MLLCISKDLKYRVASRWRKGRARKEGTRKRRRRRDRGSSRRRVLRLLAHSPEACNGHTWTRLEPGAWSSIHVSQLLGQRVELPGTLPGLGQSGLKRGFLKSDVGIQRFGLTGGIQISDIVF